MTPPITLDMELRSSNGKCLDVNLSYPIHRKLRIFETGSAGS